jgi:hypothetical protein
LLSGRRHVDVGLPRILRGGRRHARSRILLSRIGARIPNGAYGFDPVCVSAQPSAETPSDRLTTLRV